MRYQDEDWYRNHIRWLHGDSSGGRANLTDAKLSKADLTGADLYRADLSGADLTGAKLSKADLTGADLSGADLTGAKLSKADLSWADLTGAKLIGADLSGADLTGAKLIGADLSGANLYRADLYRADLTGADLTGTRLPPPSSLLLASWAKVPEDLCRDLMRYDAENHPDPSAFARWAEGGGSPYRDPRWEMSVIFCEQKELYTPLPPGERAPTALSLVLRLFKEKAIKR